MVDSREDQADPGAAPGPDAELVARALAGDETAFKSLLRPLQADLRRYLSGAVRSYGRINPDEVFTEVVTRAWLNLVRFNSQYTFRSYIFGIARMAAVRETRRRPRREQSFTDMSDSSGNIEEGPAGEVPDRPFDENSAAVDLSGLRRHPAPDQGVHTSSILREMLIAMLAYGGYPHQQVAFSCSVALWGTPKKETVGATQRGKVPITGDPDQVVREVAGESLAQMGRTLREFFEAEAHVADEDLEQAFYPYWFRLSLDVRTLFARDKASAQTFHDFSEMRVAETRLEQYFGKKPKKSVADWTDGVKTNTHKALCGTFDARRSPLPFPSDWPREPGLPVV